MLDMIISVALIFVLIEETRCLINVKKKQKEIVDILKELDSWQREDIVIEQELIEKHNKVIDMVENIINATEDLLNNIKK